MAEREANRGRWGAEIDRWRASGKGLSAWARERGLSRDALEYWKRRLAVAPRPAVTPSRPLTLIPLSSGAPEATSPIELFVGPSGCRVRLPAAFDAASLARLLDVLEARC